LQKKKRFHGESSKKRNEVLYDRCEREKEKKGHKNDKISPISFWFGGK
jgi:hypothetical protein